MKISPVILVISLSGCTNSFYGSVDSSFVRDWEHRETQLNASLNVDTDRDGVKDYWDQCMSTPEFVKVSAQGCPLDTNGNGLPDYQETTPENISHSTPSKTADFPPQAERPTQFEHADESTLLSFKFVALVYGFDLESGQINDSIHTELNTLVGRFNASDALQVIELTGHTDDLGSASYNFALAIQRAEAVATFLRTRLRSDIQVMVRGMGELLPIADNATEEGRVLNRRVEVSTLNK